MKKRNLLVSVLVIGLCGAAQVNATSKNIAVKTYSTGYFQNNKIPITAYDGTQFCALSTMTNLINVQATTYCTIRVKDGKFVLEGFADRNAGVNCSMTCFSSDSFNVVFP
ncbi:MAG: hypothetical protein ACR2PS_15040 [Pseudomonadales bacterium]